MTELNIICGLEIPEEVHDYCKKRSETQSGLFFVGYLQYLEGEVLVRTFAAREYKKDGLKITEVKRDATGSARPWCKNLLYSQWSGYVPVFEKKDVYYRCGGYPYLAFSKEDYDKWEVPLYPLNLSVSYMNVDLLKTIEEFRYCGYSGGDLISWLNNYRLNPKIEMFGKMGIGLSPVLMAKVDKDPQFRSFLWKNHKEVALYGVQALMYAYKHNISVEEARRVCSVKNSIDREVAFMVPEVKGTKIDRGKLLDYVLDLNEGSGSYNDYLKAIKALKLDLKDTKNVFPRDFKAMHDLRIGEYSSLKAKIDKENRDKLYRDFAHRCEALMSLEYTSGDLSVKIPSSIDDLIAEGDALHHCVGRLGYDLKVVEGKSIIAFIRKNSDLSKPYVTAEYSIKEEKIRQCYADHNTQPSSEVITFVGIWADKVSRFMKGANNERE